MQVSLWNMLNVLFAYWRIKVCVFHICVQHSDGLVELQGIGFLFSLARSLLKTFPDLNVWLSIICWRLLLRLNAIIGVAWNILWNSEFICKIFQFLFSNLEMLGSVLLCVIDSRILFLLFFPLPVNGSFLSILSKFYIWSSAIRVIIFWHFLKI